MNKTISEQEKIYSEQELRDQLAEAFQESAKIVMTALSFQTAYVQLKKRAAEIKSGGPKKAPPR